MCEMMMKEYKVPTAKTTRKRKRRQMVRLM